jgi:hypothetical protein
MVHLKMMGVIKPRKMRGAEHKQHGNTYRVLVGKTESRKTLMGKIILKCMFRK